MLRKLLLLLVTTIWITGCGILPEEKDPTLDWSAKRLYSTARGALQAKDYENATKYYEKLEARYPFERYAQQAQLDLAYAYYKTGEPESSVATLDRFHKLYPRHPHADYSYYLRGLVNYNRGHGFFDKWVPKDDTQRDPGAARSSFEDFSTLLRKYPNSKYVDDARQRMIYLRNRLARYEVNVSDYYTRRGAYVAAANRAEYVIQHYQKTPAVADALSLLAGSYQKLGLDDLAGDSLRVLSLNYPDHPGISDPGAMTPVPSKGLWSKMGLDN